MKNKAPKLDNELLRIIWEASRHIIYSNKKKYSRKNKHKNSYDK